MYTYKHIYLLDNQLKCCCTQNILYNAAALLAFRSLEWNKQANTWVVEFRPVLSDPLCCWKYPRKGAWVFCPGPPQLPALLLSESFIFYQYCGRIPEGGYICPAYKKPSCPFSYSHPFRTSYNVFFSTAGTPSALYKNSISVRLTPRHGATLRVFPSFILCFNFCFSNRLYLLFVCLFIKKL